MLMMRTLLATVCCIFGSWGLVIELNFGSDFEHKVWSRFWSWSSGKIFELEFGQHFAAGNDICRVMKLNLGCDTLVSWTQPSGPCNVSFCKREEKIKCMDILLNVHLQKWTVEFLSNVKDTTSNFGKLQLILPTPTLCSPELTFTQRNHFLGRETLFCPSCLT